MNVTLNIGMNGNPFHWINISRRLSYHTYGMKLKDSQLISAGIWKGIDEDVLVVRLKEVKMNKQELQSFVELLCMSFKQEAIAIKVHYEDGDPKNYSDLIYEPTLEVVRIQFNPELFVE